jgi:hypothetical protein
MNAKMLIGLGATAALAVFGAQLAEGFLGGKGGNFGRIGAKIGGGMAGVFLAQKLT